jgi:hypothetical protein
MTEHGDTDDLASLTIGHLMRRHNVARSTLYLEIKAGRLIARKLRGRTIVTAEDERAWRDALPKISPAAA